MMSLVTQPLCALAAATGQLSPHEMAYQRLSRWTLALQDGITHSQPDDGKLGLSCVIPTARSVGDTKLADELDANGIPHWLQLPTAERENAMRKLAEVLVDDPEAQLVLQNETVTIERSVGRTRPVTLAVVGKQYETRPELRSILNREYQLGRGRALLLQEPAARAIPGPHRIYYAALRPKNKPSVGTLGYHAISLKHPLQLGLLTIGAAHMWDVETADDSVLMPRQQIDVLIISGAITDAYERFRQTVLRLSPSLVLASSSQRGNLRDIPLIGRIPLITFRAAKDSYGRLTFDPQRQDFNLRIMSTEMRYADPLEEHTVALKRRDTP